MVTFVDVMVTFVDVMVTKIEIFFKIKNIVSIVLVISLVT